MQCLLLQLKSQSTREASRHADFMGNCLAVSHMCLLIYLGDGVFFAPCVVEQNKHAG